MLQHVAVCVRCSVLQCVAVCCRMLQYIEVCTSIRLSCSVSQQENLFQRVPTTVLTISNTTKLTYENIHQLQLPRPSPIIIGAWPISRLVLSWCNLLVCVATHCNTLQYTATHCNTLQHTAIHCNTLQYTATHCITRRHAKTDWM